MSQKDGVSLASIALADVYLNATMTWFEREALRQNPKLEKQWVQQVAESMVGDKSNYQAHRHRIEPWIKDQPKIVQTAMEILDNYHGGRGL